METPNPTQMPTARLEALLDGLPRQPGVYLMKDAQGRVIYVGKAGVLRNRVRSYFRSQDDLGPKVRAMVARVADFEYIVTRSEKEALLLESNLLKEHRPRYNVKLRDDKQYLYLKVATGHPLPPRLHHPPRGPGRRPLLRALHQLPGPAPDDQAAAAPVPVPHLHPGHGEGVPPALPPLPHQALHRALHPPGHRRTTTGRPSGT